MSQQSSPPRRQFLKQALAGAAAAGSTLPAAAATTSQDAPGKPAADAASPGGYLFLTPSEAAFVEALADHMVPADRHTPSGSALGIDIYIDRTLYGHWGKGDRLNLGGPWKKGLPSQGYQLPLTPAELFRSATTALDDALRRQEGRGFAELDAAGREATLVALEKGRFTYDADIPPALYFSLLYQLVVEGLFADPIYGGNAGKAGWKMVGFPGVIATHTNNLPAFKNRPWPHQTLSIADAS